MPGPAASREQVCVCLGLTVAEKRRAAFSAWNWPVGVVILRSALERGMQSRAEEQQNQCLGILPDWEPLASLSSTDPRELGVPSPCAQRALDLCPFALWGCRAGEVWLRRLFPAAAGAKSEGPVSPHPLKQRRNSRKGKFSPVSRQDVRLPSRSRFWTWQQMPEKIIPKYPSINDVVQRNQI